MLSVIDRNVGMRRMTIRLINARNMEHKTEIFYSDSEVPVVLSKVNVAS